MPVVSAEVRLGCAVEDSRRQDVQELEVLTHTAEARLQDRQHGIGKIDRPAGPLGVKDLARLLHPTSRRTACGHGAVRNAGDDVGRRNGNPSLARTLRTSREPKHGPRGTWVRYFFLQKVDEPLRSIRAQQNCVRTHPLEDLLSDGSDAWPVILQSPALSLQSTWLRTSFTPEIVNWEFSEPNMAGDLKKIERE